MAFRGGGSRSASLVLRLIHERRKPRLRGSERRLLHGDQDDQREPGRQGSWERPRVQPGEHFGVGRPSSSPCERPMPLGWTPGSSLASPCRGWGFPALERIELRPLAFTLAVFWSLQLLVCLAPAAGEAAAERPAPDSEADAHSHHHTGAAQADSEGDRAPHSHGPGPSHHQDSDGGCARHCASLGQTVAASPASVPVPNLLLVVSVPLPAFSELPRALAAGVERLEIGRSPPDLLARHCTLRI